MNISIILFPDFETLDVFGPVEVFGKCEKWTIEFYSQQGGTVSNKDNVNIKTLPIDGIADNATDVLFIPGGAGTRNEVNNRYFIDQIKNLALKSRYIFTVCTGSALLAKTGLLDGKKATSNKRAFDWVKTCSNDVVWIREARWVKDGNYYTSSGVSAGTDMALGFVSDLEGRDKALEIVQIIEYNWQEDPNSNCF